MREVQCCRDVLAGRPSLCTCMDRCSAICRLRRPASTSTASEGSAMRLHPGCTGKPMSRWKTLLWDLSKQNLSVSSAPAPPLGLRARSDSSPPARQGRGNDQVTGTAGCLLKYLHTPPPSHRRTGENWGPRFMQGAPHSVSPHSWLASNDLLLDHPQALFFPFVRLLGQLKTPKLLRNTQRYSLITPSAS